jgi:hypothetical protein
MRAVIYTTGEFPSRLCADWLRLAAGHPMAGPEWRRSWWGAYGRGLETAVGAVYRDNTLVALAPWYLDRRGWLGRSISAMGDGKACTDYQRVLLDPQLTSEEAGDALTILVDAFRRSPSLARVSAWVMEGVVSDDESMCQLRARLVSEGFEAIEESLESSWVLPLPATWNEFAAGVHRSLRRKINKAARRYEQGEVRFEAATTRSEIEAAWDDFVRLHGLRFRDRDENGGCFSDPRFGAFLRPAVLELADRGAAELVWVRGRRDRIDAVALARRRNVLHVPVGHRPGSDATRARAPALHAGRAATDRAGFRAARFSPRQRAV